MSFWNHVKFHSVLNSQVLRVTRKLPKLKFIFWNQAWPCRLVNRLDTAVPPCVSRGRSTKINDIFTNLQIWKPAYNKLTTCQNIARVPNTFLTFSYIRKARLRFKSPQRSLIDTDSKEPVTGVTQSLAVLNIKIKYPEFRIFHF